MKKKFFATSLMALMINICVILPISAHEEPSVNSGEKQMKEQSRQRISLIGIKTQTAWQIDIKDKSKHKFLVTEYDNHGNITSVTLYENEKIKDKDVFKYNYNNDMIEQSSFGENNKPEGKAIYKYDNEGNIEQYTYYKDGKAESVFKYQREKNVNKLTKYNSGDKIEYTLNYIFDKDINTGKLTNIVKYKSDNSKELEAQYKYNDQNKKSEKILLNPDNTMQHKFNYLYDENGNVKEISKTLPTGDIGFRQEFKYDSRLNLTGITEYAKNEITDKIEYSYEYYDSVVKSKLININGIESLSIIKPPATNRLRSGLVVLKEGQSVGLHNTGSYEELLIILEGEGDFLITGQNPIHIEKGVSLYCPPYNEHNVMNTGKGILKYVYVVTKL